MGFGFSTAGWRSVGAVALIATVILASCGGAATPGGGSSSGAASAAPKKPYTIGIGADLSGVFASSGTADSNGFATYFAALNEEKGGVNGHKIIVKVDDGRSDLGTSVAQYEAALANPDYLAYLESTNSAVVAAVHGRATKDGIAVSSASGYMGGTTVFPYVYNDNPSQQTFLDLVVAWATKQVANPNGAKAAWFAYSSALTEARAPVLAKTFEAKGFKMVYNERVPTTAIDFGVAAGAIAQANPDVLSLSMQDQQIVPFMTDLRARGYKGPVLNFGSNVTSASLKKINDPKLFLVVYTADTQNTKDPEVAKMLADAAKYGFSQGTDQTFFVQAYMLAKLVAAAIAKCGDTCDRKSFNDAMENTTVPGGSLMAGNPGFSPTNHTFAQKAAIAEWNNSVGYLTTIQGFGF